jgi:aldehyde:ferredoxin oxidoreductase
MYGWTGKILHIDLTHSRTKEILTELYAEKYLGGRGIASRLYWEAVTPDVKAYDPENRLIFMTGPLVGTGAQAANRMTIAGKSPMAYPEGFCYGNIGGFFPSFLKRAGYDGMVIEGRASKPEYLWIKDGTVEFWDASALWGRGTYKTGDMLRKVHGDKVHYVAIGVAGERQVRSAVMTASYESASTAGFGAVMGSKNLKAIVANGSGKVSVADPKRLKELNRYTIEISKRVRLAIPPDVTMSGRSELLEVIGKGSCYQCGVECIRGVYRYGKKLEGLRKCQSMEYYLPWHYAKDGEPIETFFDAPTLANDYGIGTFELRNINNWLYDCHQAGVLTEEETGLPLSKIGTREYLEKLLHIMANRKGFGDILAEGIVRAAEKVSDRARAMLRVGVAPIGDRDLIPARAIITHALLYPLEPRVSQPLVHNIGFLYGLWMVNHFEGPTMSPVNTKLIHHVANAFWGGKEAANFSSYEGKALAAVKIQDRTYVKECLGLCDFCWPITYSLHTSDNVGDPDLEAKIFNAATGMDSDELETYGAIICNLQRSILLREGRMTPQDDYPAEYNFTEPLSPDRPFIVPGPGDQPVDVSGHTLDRDKFSRMLKEYYRLRGWDTQTGVPLAETLTSLGMDDVWAQLKEKCL